MKLRVNLYEFLRVFDGNQARDVNTRLKHRELNEEAFLEKYGMDRRVFEKAKKAVARGQFKILGGQ